MKRREYRLRRPSEQDWSCWRWNQTPGDSELLILKILFSLLSKLVRGIVTKIPHAFFLSLIPHRCCLSHTQCRSTQQRLLSPFWVAWRWMMKRLQRPRCRSSRTQAARWRRVSLTSNRTFLNLIDTSNCCFACSRTIAITLDQMISYIFITLWLFILCQKALALSVLHLVTALYCLLLPVFCCRYCRLKPREDRHDRPSMPSTASMPCSPTGTRTSLRSLRLVSPVDSCRFPILKKIILSRCKTK